MFDGIAGQWVPVLCSEQLGVEPRTVTVASERLVVRRDAEGRAAAVVDLHQIGDAARAIPLPAVEAGGFVFVFTDRRGAGPPPALEEPAGERARRVETWAMPWTEVMERLLVQPQRSLQRDSATARRLTAWLRAETPTVVTTLRGVAVRWGSGELGVAQLDWVRPHGIELRTGWGGEDEDLLRLWCVPIDLHRTRVFVDRAELTDETGPPSAIDTTATAPTEELVLRFRRWQLRYGSSSRAAPPIDTGAVVRALR